MTTSATRVSNSEASTVPLVSLRPADDLSADCSVAAIGQVLASMSASSEPLETFASVARAAVPLLCDVCTVAIARDGEAPYQVSFPGVAPADSLAGSAAALAGAAAQSTGAIISRAINPHSAALVTDDTVLTPFSTPASEGEKGYRGVLAQSYLGYRPTVTQVLIGQLLVERATAVVQRQRLLAKNEHLQRALASNREIGAAMGILMIEHKLTGDQAFDLLRRASQHSHRKLASLAAEVAQTGTLDLPPGVGMLGQTDVPRPSRRSRAPRARSGA